MGFFSGKNSTASAPNTQQAEFNSLRAELESRIQELEAHLARYKDELTASQEKCGLLQSSLNDRERLVRNFVF